MNKKIAVVLSGCGFCDGAEINEAILTLLAIQELGAAYQCFAPNKEQHHVINHLDGTEIEQTRNVLVESARITRGNIKPLTSLEAQEFDALIIPGGYGVAKNLSQFAISGNTDEIDSDFLKVCKDFKAANKPAGYMCIAPVLLPQIYGTGIQCTIGTDNTTAAVVNNTGGEHKDCAVTDIIIDQNNKVVSTPAYMTANSILEAKQGIDKLVQAIIEMS